MSNNTIELHEEVLTTREAAHLLRRSTYNYNIDRIKEFTFLTATEAVDELFDFDNVSLKFPNGPLNWQSGATPPIFNLLTSSFLNTLDANKRGRADIIWRTVEALYDVSARWKVVHWLHTIFPVRTNIYFHQYWQLLIRCLGEGSEQVSLETIALKITTDKSMMIYLNNEENVAAAPNENFAREVLELMTIRKGPSLSLGNYTHYTEDDIENAAKVLTGFTVATSGVEVQDANSLHNTDLHTEIMSAVPDPDLHDFSEKTFSTELVGTGTQSTIAASSLANDDDKIMRMYEELIEFYGIVFNNDETAYSLVRRMYQFFVRDEINHDIETNIIVPLGDDLKLNNYDYIRTLKILLTSKHFFDLDDTDPTNEIIGAKIKSPWELVFQSINIMEVPEMPSASQSDIEKLFYLSFKVFPEQHFRSIGMNLRGPDTVEGYQGFYDEPNYSKNWFSSSTLFRRYTIGESLKGNFTFNDNNPIFEVDFPFQIPNFLTFFDQFDEVDANGDVIIGTPPNPSGVADVDHVVSEMLSYFLPEYPEPIRYEYFRNALLGGLSTINWYFSWKAYVELDTLTPAEEATSITNNVKVGLERLFDAIMSSPEFQTF